MDFLISTHKSLLDFIYKINDLIHVLLNFSVLFLSLRQSGIDLALYRVEPGLRRKIRFSHRPVILASALGCQAGRFLLRVRNDLIALYLRFIYQRSDLFVIVDISAVLDLDFIFKALISRVLALNALLQLGNLLILLGHIRPCLRNFLIGVSLDLLYICEDLLFVKTAHDCSEHLIIHRILPSCLIILINLYIP